MKPKRIFLACGLLLPCVASLASEQEPSYHRYAFSTHLLGLTTISMLSSYYFYEFEGEYRLSPKWAVGGFYLFSSQTAADANGPFEYHQYGARLDYYFRTASKHGPYVSALSYATHSNQCSPLFVNPRVAVVGGYRVVAFKHVFMDVGLGYEQLLAPNAYCYGASDEFYPVFDLNLGFSF